MKCPDCTDGTYVGFNHTEPCRTCGGTMEVSRDHVVHRDDATPDERGYEPAKWTMNIEPLRLSEGECEFIKAVDSYRDRVARAFGIPRDLIEIGEADEPLSPDELRGALPVPEKFVSPFYSAEIPLPPPDPCGGDCWPVEWTVNIEPLLPTEGECEFIKAKDALVRHAMERVLARLDADILRGL